MNNCEGCQRNCCMNFKITTELVNPKEGEEELNRFPFIKRVGQTLVLCSDGHEKIVGVYACDRFDIRIKECMEYETQPRPIFCQTTGNVTSPHNKCLLKSKDDHNKAA